MSVFPFPHPGQTAKNIARQPRKKSYDNYLINQNNKQKLTSILKETAFNQT